MSSHILLEKQFLLWWCNRPWNNWFDRKFLNIQVSVFKTNFSQQQNHIQITPAKNGGKVTEWGCSSVVERPLRMRKVSGSNPDSSNDTFLSFLGMVVWLKIISKDLRPILTRYEVQTTIYCVVCIAATTNWYHILCQKACYSSKLKNQCSGVQFFFEKMEWIRVFHLLLIWTDRWYDIVDLHRSGSNWIKK